MPTAAYFGVVNLPLQTFTTTYVSFQAVPWGFASNALMPMDGAVRFDVEAGANTLLAVGATIFDFKTGATKYNYGNVAAGASAVNGGALCWKRGIGNAGNIAGWLWPNSRFPFNLSDNVTLGVTKTTALITTAGFAPLPAQINTAIPEPFCGGGWYDVTNLITTSWRLNLAQRMVSFNPVTTTVGGDVATNIVFSTSYQPAASIPYNGYNWLWISDPTAGVPNKHLLQTSNFVNAASNSLPLLINPPGSSIDLSAQINAVAPVGQSGPFSTYSGWLWICRNTLTIGTQTLNGFGILVSPDFTGYQIINFVPVDATAAGWQGGPTEVFSAKIDDTGVLFLKKVLSASTIFSSLPTATKIIETFPPIGLPSPPDDSQITVRALRGYAL